MIVATALAALALTGPALTVPEDRLADALECHVQAGDVGREPVLLVHGTATNTEESWSWNWMRGLPALGFGAVCAVDLPDRALGDIQVAAEYVVHAVREMHERFGGAVDVVGHSQGPIEPRWAIRWWPDVAEIVDDHVALSPPNHGATTIDAICAGPECLPAAWQMTSDSDFLAVLNAGDETPAGVDWTSIISNNDGLVVPPRTSRLDGASNVVVQDLCPLRTVDHFRMLYDYARFAIAVDALMHPGGADTGRIGRRACARDLVPGATYAEAIEAGSTLAISGGPYAASYPRTREEPPLRDYATASQL